MVERPVVLERLHHLGNRRQLLADRDVDADDAGVPLVDDRVHRDRGLPGLAVSDDELALAAADGDHGVHRLDSGLERLLHRLPGDDARSDALHRARFGRLDRSLAVQRTAQGVHHAPLHGLAHRHLQDPPGALRGVALPDRGHVAEENESHGRLFEVQCEAEHVVGQFHQLAVHDPLQAMHAGDPVPGRHDGSNFRDVDIRVMAGDLFPQQGGDFVCSNTHGSSCNLLILGPL